MSDKPRILITGGRGSAKLVSAMIAAGFNVTEDETELLREHKDEFYLHAAPKIAPVMILPENNNFIQQKMQGKRRVY